ncbi:AAA family ATPase [Amphibiibacter pelophylacis]|uniref:ATP-binding domain-containing protein n=1 Tax=Amphibiibacter pelophylacis TaxID=1799477 RepID=A0ACC6P3Q8_9BURK
MSINPTESHILHHLQSTLTSAYTIFHTLYWADTDAARDHHGEFDIVVMNRAGDLAILEVKGGAVELAPSGVFKRYGTERKDVGQQARRQFHHLQARIRQRGWYVRLLHFLVLPQHRLPPDEASLSYPRERILDSQDCADLAGALARTLGQGMDKPEQREAVERFLLDWLGLQLDVSVLAGQMAQRVRAMSGGLATWVLRMAAPSGVIRVQATAGSGKTQLALRLLQRAADASQRASYVCFNRPLADHLRQIAPGAGQGVQVATFHQLCWEHAGRPADRGDAAGLDALSQAFIAAAPRQSADLDLLVIDEMQDLRADWISALLPRLKDTGQLFTLEDASQGLYPDREEVDIPDAVHVTSQDNHRSPRRVVELINLLHLTPQPITACNPWRGELPGLRTWQPESQRLQAETIAAVTRCLELGFALKDIAVLTWRGRDHSALQQDTLGEWPLRHFTGAYDAHGRPCWSDGELVLETIRRFKGQSAPAVVLTEIDFDAWTPEVRALLFVGLTRAQMHVELVLSPRADALLTAAISAHD